MDTITPARGVLLGIASMAAVVIASNILVQYPVTATLGALDLADLLTWGAFTYPVAFLVTDLVNRRFGPARARQVVAAGFLLAVALSAVLASPRIAIASGSAFLAAQLLGVAVFDRLRRRTWWTPPLVSSVLGSILDTLLFFTLAFAAFLAALGPSDAFAVADAPFLAIAPFEAPRWLSWAVADLGVKLIVALLLLIPYRAVLAVLGGPRAALDPR